MRHFIKQACCILLFLLPGRSVSGQPAGSGPYDDYFTGERLRIDLTFAGNAAEQHIFLSGLKHETAWSGSRTNLNDPFRYGEYLLELKDSTGSQTLFSKGFSTLFQEWRTTPEATTTPRSFNSSYWTPFPKQKVTLVVSERKRETGRFVPLFETIIDPGDKQINREKENEYTAVPILYNGEPQHKVDLLFIAEGYTADEMEKFRADARRFSNDLFEMEPYKSRQADFNIWAVESVSKDSGTDIPHHDIWKNTAANSNFYTFQTDRYLTAPDQTTVCKLASNAPCDALYVIVNTDKYGGGGIYNFYGLSMSDNKLTPMVFVHEFGHSFAGLADEYYESETAYEGFYNLQTEPWEPNITTLVDFGKKWKDRLDADVPVPTPATEEYNTTIGVYEGGGYMSKGIYRPFIDCRMHTNKAAGFCPVCREAINKMIDYYCQ